jgi:aryl-alcohol dehydrogenase-like predicted oxidoreductase
MQRKSLGQSGIDIAPLVFGGNVLGWTADTQQSFALLDRCLERGFNTIDTADVYSAFAPGNSGGESEDVIGQWLSQRGRRDDVIVMSKVGMLEQRKGLSATNIEAAVDDSLKRLRTDYLDIYFAHIDDQDVPLEETLGAFGRLVEKGKVRALGASNYSAERARQALEISKRTGLPRFEVLQPEYNLYDRAGFETELASLAEENDLGVVSYFALASGFLTGKYQRIEDLGDRPRAEFLKRYFDERGHRILQELMAASDALQAKPAQVALAWLMARRAITAPIVSATNIEQLDEILDAVNVVVPEIWTSRLDAASSAVTAK